LRFPIAEAELLDDRDDAVGHLLDRLVLPETEDAPAHLLELPVVAAVSGDVGLKLRHPVVGVALGSVACSADRGQPPNCASTQELSLRPHLLTQPFLFLIE